MDRDRFLSSILTRLAEVGRSWAGMMGVWNRDWSHGVSLIHAQTGLTLQICDSLFMSEPVLVVDCFGKGSGDAPGVGKGAGTDGALR